MKQIAVTLFLALCTVLPFSLSAHAIDKNTWTDSDCVVIEYSPRPIVSSDGPDAIHPDSTDESVDEIEGKDEKDGEPVETNIDGIVSPTYTISPDVTQAPVSINE